MDFIKPSIKSKKRQLRSTEPPKHTALQTISENQPLRAIQPPIDTAQLHREITALRKQCASLEAQRNDALEALDEMASAPQAQISTYTSKIKELETQRNEAFEALDEVVSAPPPRHAASLLQIQTLESQKRVLEERCKTFSAWAEQQRLESNKHKETSTQLSETLSDFYITHSKLYAQHQELEARMDALIDSQGPSGASESTSKELRAVQTRAVDAEKTVQSLLGVRSLVKSAPVALELTTKTRSILQSVIEILNLANDPSAPNTIQACMTQVCSALADLGDEAAGHTVVANGWLAKRDSVLRSLR
jgi:predicted  nucleic acid-binding Zn-ribbon protein